MMVKTFDKKVSVGIVGATGAVGQALIGLLQRRHFPLKKLLLLASARSAGEKLSVGGQSWTVKEARPEVFTGLDIVFFSAGGLVSRELVPSAVSAGCLVIDNSSVYRMDETVPLVVPEVNASAAWDHQGIIANPNCSTAISLMGLAPLHRAFGLRSFIASTYQAVSGSGTGGIVELKKQIHAGVKGEVSEPDVYPYPIAYNVIPQVDVFQEGGYTKEEYKMLHESRKILNLPNLEVSTTCVRVPVMRAHSLSIHACFEKPVTISRARDAIDKFPGVVVRDDPSKLDYPMPLDYSEVESCAVGRIRQDAVLPNGLAMWVVGDQIWKGAALNAIQIAEIFVKKSS